MRRVLIVVGVLVLLALPAHATSGDYVDVTCPVCGNVFEAWEWHSTNNLGGCDMDGCEHGAGGTVFVRTCWTCPACLYTGLQHEWQEEEHRPTDLIERLKGENPLKAVTATDPKTKRTDDIPAGTRWDLYLQVLELQEADTHALISALLRTAWTQRFESLERDNLRVALDQLCTAYWDVAHRAEGERRNVYREYIEIARALEADAIDEDLHLSALERQHRLLESALLYKRRGEDPDAARVLAVLRAAYEQMPSPIVEVVEELDARIAWERKYLARAVPRLAEVAVSKELPAEHLPWVLLRLGELQRKTGDAAAAVLTFQKALGGDLPERAEEMLRDRLEKAKSQIPAAGK